VHLNIAVIIDYSDLELVAGCHRYVPFRRGIQVSNGRHLGDSGVNIETFFLFLSTHSAEILGFVACFQLFMHNVTQLWGMSIVGRERQTANDILLSKEIEFTFTFTQVMNDSTSNKSGAGGAILYPDVDCSFSVLMWLISVVFCLFGDLCGWLVWFVASGRLVAV